MRMIPRLLVIFLSSLSLSFIGTKVYLASLVKSPISSKDFPRVQKTKGVVREARRYKTAKYRIAIIDSGFDESVGVPLRLCETGHFDFSTRRSRVAVGSVLHGTAIGAIIAGELKDVDYCAMIYQIDFMLPMDPTPNIIEATQMVRKFNATAINMSYVGPTHSFTERRALRDLASDGVAMFAAAGNDDKDMSTFCHTYPACYRIRGLYTVGALDPMTLLKASYSNYGDMVSIWYSGEFEFQGHAMIGTSFAAPRALTDYILSLEAN